MPSWLVNEENNVVIATVRDLSAKGLQELDVTDVASIKKAAEEAATLFSNGLDYLINRADISPRPMTSFEDLDLKLLADELSFNTITAIQMISALLPLLKKSAVKKIIFITSILSSLKVGGLWQFISNSYSISKAALNMPASRLARKWGAVIKHEGIAVALIHPGCVQTDLGDEIKEWMETYSKNVPQITTAQSSAGVLAVVRKASFLSELN